MVKQNHKNTHETAEALEEIKFPSPGLNKVGPVGQSWPAIKLNLAHQMLGKRPPIIYVKHN